MPEHQSEPMKSRWPISEPEIVSQVGGDRYELGTEICANNMTETRVFLAKEKMPPFRDVVIKVVSIFEGELHAEGNDGTTPWDRFCREADMWSRFAPALNVLPLYETINQRVESEPEFRRLGFVMEHSKLGDLGRHMTSELISKQSKSQKLRFMISIATAIQAGHSYQVVHGDIKPKNILLFIERSTLIPKVMDFGMSASASGDTHVHGGTPEYMAPECFESVSSDRSHLTTTSDIYSLGVVFHELITGRQFVPPVVGSITLSERWQRCKEQHTNAKIDRAACTEFSPQFVELLGRMLSQVGVGSGRPVIGAVVEDLEAILEEVERASMMNPEAEISIRRGMYRWNPVLHEMLGANLYYFMIKGRWSKADIPWLQTRFDDIQIRCYSLYRVLGAYDFILRVWLRQSHLVKLQEVLEHFSNVHQGHVEMFSVERAEPFYGAFGEIKGDTQEALDTILIAERESEAAQVKRLVENNLAMVMPSSDYAKRRFFLLFPIGRAGINIQPQVVRYYADQIRNALLQVPQARQVSVYSGKGPFSLMVKVRCEGIEEFRIIHSQLVDHCMTFRLNDYPIAIQTYVELYEPVRESDDGTVLGDVARRKSTRRML